MSMICLGDPIMPGCGKILSDQEIEYYGRACEACERAWSEIVEAWRRGGANSEMDALFDTARSIQ